MARVCVGGKRRRRQESEQTVQNVEEVSFLFKLEATLEHLTSSHPPGCYSCFTLINYCYSGTLSERLSDSRYFGTQHISSVPACDAKCSC